MRGLDIEHCSDQFKDVHAAMHHRVQHQTPLHATGGRHATRVVKPQILTAWCHGCQVMQQAAPIQGECTLATCWVHSLQERLAGRSVRAFVPWLQSIDADYVSE